MSVYCVFVGNWTAFYSAQTPSAHLDRPDLRRAVALDSAGNPDAALRVLGDAYRRHPYDREVLLGLASILRDRGRAKEATRYAEELVAVMPESAEAKRILEEIRSKGGR